VQQVLGRLGQVKRNGAGWMAQCPAHDDNNPSLSISQGADGKVLIKCHAGCSVDSVVAALELSLSDLFPKDPIPTRTRKSPRRAWRDRGEMIASMSKRLGRLVGEWKYPKPRIAEEFHVLRFQDGNKKQYRPIHRTGDGWRVGDPEGPLPLYRIDLCGRSEEPVFVAEGEKCVDALLELSVSATTSAHGSESARKSDWSPLTELGRRVVLLPDNDDAGRKYIAVVADLCAGADLRVVELPGLRRGEDVFDFIERRRSEGAEDSNVRQEILELAARAEPIPHRAESKRAGQYWSDDRGTWWDKHTKDGTVTTQLANFRASIEAQVIESDGVEERRYLELRAEVNGRESSFRVPAGSFSSMNWAMEHLGPAACVEAGFGTRDHVRAAIQKLSPATATKRVFTHTGWTQIEGEGFCYLHAGGAVGTKGTVAGVEVELPESARDVHLPEEKPEPSECASSIDAFLSMGDARLTYPLLGAVARAPIGGSDLSVYVAGPSGVYKTCVAAIAQSFWGAGFNDRRLPGSWSSTANSLEMLAFTFKDGLLIIDDFAPGGSTQDVRRLHQAADRLLRAQGNRSGRGRLRSDGTLRPAKPPRGMIISTGEDIPAGHSLRARLFILEVSQGDVDLEWLTKCQHRAERGVFAGVLARYVCWLAPRLGSVRERIRDRVSERRTSASRSLLGHARAPGNAAELGASVEVFAKFLVDEGAIAEERSARMIEKAWAAIEEAAQAQVSMLEGAEPTVRFLELLSSAIGSGEAHLAGPEGGKPENPEAAGWRKGADGTRDYIPHGTRAGWVDGEDLFLDIEAALKASRRMCGEAESLALTSRTLAKRLQEKGRLQSRDAERGKNTIRRKLEGKRRVVLHLHASTLGFGSPGSPGSPESPSEPCPTPPGTETRDRDAVRHAIRVPQDRPSGEPAGGQNRPPGTNGTVGTGTGEGGPEWDRDA